MQNLIFYVAAGGPLGTVSDYANAKKNAAPTLVLGAACCLRMRLFSDDNHSDPFPLSDLAAITSWSWQMDKDFDASTTCKIIGDNSDIYAHSVEDTINGETSTYTEVVIPISNMLTEELVALIGSSESVSLSGELCGYDQNADLVFVLQIKNFTVRNRISATGDPTELDPEYLTEAQVRALVYGGWDVEFSADAENWHSTQAASDRYIRFRLSGEANAEWSNPVALITGPQGPMPVISAGSATSLSPGSNPSVEVVSSGGSTFVLNLGIPAGSDGVTPVLSGGFVTTLPAGSSATAELASSGGSTYILNLGIPRGADGVMAFPIQSYSSESAYSSMTCIAYNGGGYQVTSDTTAGENPDNAPGKFICFASSGAVGSTGPAGSDGSNGSNGVSPVVSVTQTASGAIVYTSDYLGSSSVEIRNGSDGSNGMDASLIGTSQTVSSLVSGAIVLQAEAVPVALRTSEGNIYPVEKGTITISSGAWTIDPAAYLAYDGVSAFAGPWTVYYAGGIPDIQIIHSGGSAIVPTEHQVYQIQLTSGTSITVDSSGLTSSVAMTAELWLDMPSTPVSFTLPGFTWLEGAAPDLSAGSTRYVLTVRWNGTKFLACSAYEEALT